MMDTATLESTFSGLQTGSDRYGTFASLFSSVSKEEMHEGYKIALNLYNNRRYEESSAFFRILVQAAPEKAEYRKGLGASFQMLKMYDEALACYASVIVSGGESPDLSVYVYAADCYLASNQVEKALVALKTARKQAARTGNTRVLKHASLMIDIWEQTLPSDKKKET